MNMIGMEISLEKIHEAPICRCNILEDLPTNLKNDIDDEDYRGIRELIKGNYSDRAHFIYELLQNADDAGATHAEFFLARDKLLFKHDGKEKFTISNPNEKTGIRGHINAITSIGNSTKDYEVNKIGKNLSDDSFGVVPYDWRCLRW